MAFLLASLLLLTGQTSTHTAQATPSRSFRLSLNRQFEPRLFRSRPAPFRDRRAGRRVRRSSSPPFKLASASASSTRRSRSWNLSMRASSAAISLATLPASRRAGSWRLFGFGAPGLRLFGGGAISRARRARNPRGRRRKASPCRSATSQSRSAQASSRRRSCEIEDAGAFVIVDRLDQLGAAVDVEMVGRLVEDQQLRPVKSRQAHQEARLLAARRAGRSACRRARPKIRSCATLARIMRFLLAAHVLRDMRVGRARLARARRSDAGRRSRRRVLRRGSSCPTSARAGRRSAWRRSTCRCRWRRSARCDHRRQGSGRCATARRARHSRRSTFSIATIGGLSFLATGGQRNGSTLSSTMAAIGCILASILRRDCACAPWSRWRGSGRRRPASACAAPPASSRSCPAGCCCSRALALELRIAAAPQASACRARDAGCGWRRRRAGRGRG